MAPGQRHVQTLRWPQTTAAVPRSCHTRPVTLPRPSIAVIGGSGFAALLPGGEVEAVAVETPYGDPSSEVLIGAVDGRAVAFLPRHGAGHRYPAHRINYRANLWALRALGVRRVLAACAVGGLSQSLGPGSLVVPDQLVDRTSHRIQTYFDVGACHIAFADPYCGELRAELVRAANRYGAPVTDGGTMVVIEGPRFSTRAESQWYARQGWSLVNMTGHPEAVLSRELAMCYATIALVTDLDAGVDSSGAVDQVTVLSTFARNVDVLQGLLRGAAATVPAAGSCACGDVHRGMTLPIELP